MGPYHAVRRILPHPPHAVQSLVQVYVLCIHNSTVDATNKPEREKGKEEEREKEGRTGDLVCF